MLGKIRIPLHYRALLLVLFLAIALLFSSCATPTVHLTKNDLQALQNIYEEGNWTFQQSSVNVRVNEGGAVKLSIAGEAIEKVSSGNNSIWIPVALLKELPEYYGTDGDNSSQVKLMAYKVKGGLWSIVALIPGTDEKAQVKEAPTAENASTASSLGTQKQPQTRRVSLNVLMISPVFAQSLPLNLPVGQGVASVQTSVELPTKAKFTSLWTRGDGESVKLTELPSSISEGKVKALARLQPELAPVWDFSDIGYRLPGDKFSRQGLLNMAQWVSLLCAVALAVWIGWELWMNQELISRLRPYTERADSRELYVLGEQIQELVSRLRSYPRRADYRELYVLGERIQELVSRLRSYPRRADSRELYVLGEQIQELISRLRPYPERAESREELYLLDLLREQLQEFMSRLRSYPERAESREDERAESREELYRKRRRFWFYTAVAVLAVIALVFFILSVALSNEPNGKSKNSSETSLLLGNFSLNINSSDYNSDKVKATLSFLPLSTKLEPNNKGQIAIEFGGNKVKLVEQNNEPDTVKVNVATVDPSSPQLKYKIENIPIKIVEDLEVLTSASKRNVQIDQYDNIADIYNQALKTEPKPVFIEMEYEISDVLTKKEQIPERYFNWFPMDKSLLEMPIKVEGAISIVSQIEVETPTDLHTQVKQSGIEEMDFSLKRAEKQVNKYLLRPGLNKFILINSGSKVTITGNYERNLPGKAFLTAGIVIIGGCIGWLVGLFSSDWKSLWQGIGVIVGGSLLAFIAAIVVNRDFQSIISLRGQISFFDIFLLWSLLSLVVTAILMRKSQVTPTPLSQKSVWVFFVIVSCVMPILVAIFVHP
ncbi:MULTISPECIES: hypothetical protein [unclassified Microcystis]|uniref:Uncharacterized protein n=1 Tax=Microcystis flos-aquae Mf_QC_C_20070823_S10D TaxID=2486236 RepID=A0A552KQF1_9CHRO|nr:MULTISPECIES: hypothetical protein [unclassified Microcystis]MCA2797049.1 hypothetical protein [Microcystis sp. M100S2]TRT76837.1 MAG: hypothetical protein EWV64_10370 [Microcystis flos-aquae Ma_QC_C_20070823_S18]TRV10218.1 MAG: hypothetical protein EWV45_14035 [Microcystis flos-aquae Mf_QC_C_20070823_S10D]TRV20266.1 MAG: hypothetical protein EWV72_19845 [Microcystis flos-aquae Mf_QC_C_20070823_S10]